MRPLFIAALSAVLIAATAAAQTPPVAQQSVPASPAPPSPTTRPGALIARPAPATRPVPIVDVSRYPRDLDRGDVIIEYSAPGSPRRTFGEAGGTETPLERMTLNGSGEIYCGSAAESEALAPADGKPAIACFSDDDHDGAADHIYAVTNNDGRQMTLAAPRAIAPRTWDEEPAAERRLSFRYGGPNSGNVLASGRMGEGTIEIQIIMVADEQEHPLISPRSLPCLEDGRCLPLSVGDGRNIMLSAPTVEGAIHVQLVDDQEAQRVRTAIEAQHAAEIADKNATESASRPSPQAAPVAPPTANTTPPATTP